MISTASAIVFNRSPRGLIRRVAVKAHAPQIPDGIARTALSRVQTRLTATERLDAVLERFELAVITEHAALEFAVQLTDETVLRVFRIGPVERYVLFCVDANPRAQEAWQSSFQRPSTFLDIALDFRVRGPVRGDGDITEPDGLPRPAFAVAPGYGTGAMAGPWQGGTRPVIKGGSMLSI
jgi:hypothetical protein